MELFGVAIDNNLRFDKHLPHICLRANRFKKRRILFKAFIESQF